LEPAHKRQKNATEDFRIDQKIVHNQPHINPYTSKPYSP
jgi:hypothetical protein